MGVSIKYYYQHYRFKTQLPGTVVMLNLFSMVLAERSFDKSNTSLNIVHKTLNILYINKYIKNALNKINTKSCLKENQFQSDFASAEYNKFTRIGIFFGQLVQWNLFSF